MQWQDNITKARMPLALSPVQIDSELTAMASAFIVGTLPISPMKRIAVSSAWDLMSSTLELLIDYTYNMTALS